MSELGTKSDVICFESEAFYALIGEVVERLGKVKASHPKWVNDAEAMKLLGIASKTTLQKFRDEGRIRYSQPSRKVILYERESIMQFLEHHAKETF